MTSGFDSSYLLGLVTFAYFAAALAYLVMMVFKKEAFGLLGFLAALLTAVVHTGAIAWRWIESYQLGPGFGHAPFSNLYESLIFFAWTIAVVYLVMERLYRNRTIGVFILPLPFLAMAYAGLQPADIQPLVPALKSNWLIAHVITCFLGYAGFALAAGLAVVYLLKKTDWDLWETFLLTSGVAGAAAVYLVVKLAYWNAALVTPVQNPIGLAVNFFIIVLPLPLGLLAAAGLGYLLYLTGRAGRSAILSLKSEILDSLIYQNIVIGFLLLTAGIVTGAIWAHTAWGSYWSWDPKETWSLITWFVYAAVLHARMVRGWAGRRIAVLALIGFGCVLFTYFGVNLLLSGLHSYATGK
ncbi:MAG: c-type cytochrome biogenesis protein CcsB [Thermodesulfobacteriota bacterium]